MLPKDLLYSIEDIPVSTNLKILTKIYQMPKSSRYLYKFLRRGYKIKYESKKSLTLNLEQKFKAGNYNLPEEKYYKSKLSGNVLNLSFRYFEMVQNIKVVPII
jgi:hypothetical protein